MHPHNLHDGNSYNKMINNKSFKKLFGTRIYIYQKPFMSLNRS